MFLLLATRDAILGNLRDSIQQSILHSHIMHHVEDYRLLAEQGQDTSFFMSSIKDDIYGYIEENTSEMVTIMVENKELIMILKEATSSYTNEFYLWYKNWDMYPTMRLTYVVQRMHRELIDELFNSIVKAKKELVTI